ncbi:MAG: hypothetical protein E6F99_17290 [Actinobacteria bacterium]|nr:MAG: hypothetical protein E6F99_17290 [Actinomycetota bacterium]
MSDLAERLRGLVVEARSPDGHLAGRYGGDGAILDVTMTGGMYGLYREHQLERQLAELTTRLWNLTEAQFAQPLRDDGIDFGPERRRYLAGFEQLTATGSAAEDAVTVRTRGLSTWEYTIRAGTLRRVGERDLLAAVRTAVRRLLRKFHLQVFVLRDEVYDLGFPEDLRRELGFGRRGDPGRLYW